MQSIYWTTLYKTQHVSIKKFPKTFLLADWGKLLQQCTVNDKSICSKLAAKGGRPLMSFGTNDVCLMTCPHFQQPLAIIT